ncbi:hypothetical protein K438DRAFT_1783384 [Mycena galopus ATCC 62051]|nr:hypothetical protein K438DRAFT_1783384 [Mycena galopus ATCC 62051]
MPASRAPTSMSTKTKCAERLVSTVLRDLCTTVALCYLITLVLVRLIALHLDSFAPPASCGGTSSGGGAEYRAYQHFLENLSQVDVLKVTTPCSVVAFAALELGVLLASRAGIACQRGDVECGSGDVQSVPEHPLPEKQYFEIAP